jgi:DNA repair protein RadA/Sms
MAGGLKVEEPAADLAVCSSIVSSLRNFNIRNDIVVIGEVGLGGEVRSVNNIQKRINEAAKLGFRTVIVPNNNMKSIHTRDDIEIIPVVSVTSAFDTILKTSKYELEQNSRD